MAFGKKSQNQFATHRRIQLQGDLPLAFRIGEIQRL